MDNLEAWQADLGLTETFDSCGVFHKFQLVGANVAVILAISGQGLLNSNK